MDSVLIKVVGDKFFRNVKCESLVFIMYIIGSDGRIR